MTVEQLTTRVVDVEISMDDLRRMVAETTEIVSRTLRRMDQRSQETDRRLQEINERMDQRSRETDRRLQEINERMDQRSQETDERMDRGFQELRETLARHSQEMNETIDRLSQRVEHTSKEVDRVSQETNEKLARSAQDRDANIDRGLQELRENIEYVSRRMDATNEKARESSEQFQQRLDEYIRESREERKQLRRELASVTHGMGRMVEDLVAPSMPGILPQVISCDEGPQMLGVRVSKKIDGRFKEYDVLAICGDYLLITEVKTRIRTGDVEQFLEALSQARTFLPEYAEKQIIGALATFYVDEAQVLEAERKGLVVLGVVDGLMQVLNQQAFRPISF